MVQILKDVYSDVSLGSVLGFKGGTALYLFYQLPRFSVDLDFDLLDETKKEMVFQKVGTIIKKYGEVRDARDKYYNIFFLLSYKKGESQLKVETSKRVFGSSYELKNYLGIPMLVMKLDDMFAHKLVALLERNEIANRDIFDIWFLLKDRNDVNWDIVEERTGMKQKDYLEKCVRALEALPNKNILSGMGELLDEKMKIWAKENLLKDVIFLLKLKVETL